MSPKCKTGPQPLYESAMKRTVTLFLTEELYEVAKALGDRNVSAGVRAALAAAAKRKKRNEREPSSAT